MNLTIDQNKNYRADFGHIFRSSAIFAVLPEAHCTISLLNYWKVKNGLDISIVVTERTNEGKLVNRSYHEFGPNEILNIVPGITQGSIEVEAFGNRNMRIPYAAVMGIYETANSIALVHSYGRNHSWSEIEDGVAVLEARESCISLRADTNFVTRTFFHNGSAPIEGQTGKLIISAFDGTESDFEFELSPIAPFETVTFDFSKLAPRYRDLLRGEDGWATLHFANTSAFPRMLVCWTDLRNGAIQTTHSNFDYATFDTNLVSLSKPAVMALPALPPEVVEHSVVFYPRCHPGRYELDVNGASRFTRGGDIIAMERSSKGSLRVHPNHDELPARIVTAILGRTSREGLPFECSLGVLHELRPPKRFHWSVVSHRLASHIYLTRYESIYDPGAEVDLIFTLYGASKDEPQSKTMEFGSLDEVPARFRLEELFPDAEDALGDNIGYITLFSKWGGFMMFTSLSKANSFAMEHSF